jgi:opacity protein-like surface antigen
MFFVTRLQALRSICGIIGLAASLLAVAAHGQVVPSATSSTHVLWVGGEYSYIHASFPYGSNQRLWGIGALADYHLSNHIGLEAEARFLRFNSFYGEAEDNYLAGPRYFIGRFGRIQPFAQFLTGIGKIQYPFQIGSGTYTALAPGAGVNYRFGRRCELRGEYEYQLWPGSPNFVNEPSHQIQPSGLHIGLAYRLLR